jgi:hypothetical protein
MGRSKRRGERFPGGKLKPGQGGHPVAVGQRARLDWRRAGLDPQGATQLGRLGIIGELNQSKVAAGFKVAEVYGLYENSIGRRRSGCTSADARGDQMIAVFPPFVDTAFGPRSGKTLRRPYG